MWLTLLWANRRVIGEVVGLTLVAAILWWAFWFNPHRIDALQAEKTELLRQVEAGKQALTLLDDIQKGKVKINAHVQSQISTVRSAAMPRSTVIIHGGGVLPTLPTTIPAH